MRKVLIVGRLVEELGLQFVRGNFHHKDFIFIREKSPRRRHELIAGAQVNESFECQGIRSVGGIAVPLGRHHEVVESWWLRHDVILGPNISDPCQGPRASSAIRGSASRGQW